MRKLLLSAVCVAALASPALAGGGGWQDEGSKIEQGITIDQIGINNGAVAVQIGSTEELELGDGVLSELETGLDQGEMEFQNVNWVIGDGSIDRVQNINDDVDGDVNNGDIAITETEIEVDVAVAWNGGQNATKGGTAVDAENAIVANIDEINLDLPPF